MDWSTLFQELTKGLTSIELGNVIMMAVGGVMIYLAIAKEYEPVLLLPIGVGTILANIPLTGMGIGEAHGLFDILYQAGIANELFPLLIFIGVWN